MPFHRQLRKRLLAGERLLGTTTFTNSVDHVEVAGLAGMDAVLIDMEHAARDWAEVAALIRAIELGGAAPIVRVQANERPELLHVLELGAEGVCVPQVETVEEVERASAAIRYAPLGNRGTCPLVRAASFGLSRKEFASTVAEANSCVTLIGLVESRRGIENLPELLAVDPGLDAVWLGPTDLAADLGYPDQVDHPEVVRHIELAVDCVTASGKPLVWVLSTPDEVADWMHRPVGLFLYGIDTLIYWQELRRAKEVMATIAGRTAQPMA